MQSELNERLMEGQPREIEMAPVNHQAINESRASDDDNDQEDADQFKATGFE